MQKKILIFGAGGFVGTRFIRLAESKGIEPIGYDNRSPLFRSADITDKHQLEQIFRNEKPDGVVNVAAISDIDFAENNRELAWNINVNGAHNLAFLCTKYKARYVFFSSDAVFGGNEKRYSEDSPAMPVNYYGQTKKEAEKLVREACPSAAIIRISLVLGFPVHSGNSFSLKLRQTLENGQTVEFPVDEFRTPIEVGTLCECVLELLGNGYEGVLHLGSTNTLNRFEIASLFAQNARLNSDLIKAIGQAPQNGKAPRHKNGILNVERAQQLLQTPLLTAEQFIEKSILQP